MNTLNFKIYLIIILILFSIKVFSQTDTNRIFYTRDISIEYISGQKESINFDVHKVTIVPNTESLDNISRIIILNDSLLRITYENPDDVQLNINKISGVSIKSGSNFGLGIGLGALIGLGIGVGIGTANESPGWFQGLATAGGGLIGMLSGALIGGIIGGSTSGYETFEFGDKIDKIKELERILKINKKLNGF